MGDFFCLPRIGVFCKIQKKENVGKSKVRRDRFRADSIISKSKGVTHGIFSIQTGFNSRVGAHAVHCGTPRDAADFDEC